MRKVACGGERPSVCGAAACVIVFNKLVNYATPADQLSLTFAALADPTRRAIMTRLAAGEATVSELAEPFPVSLPAISRHLKVLERAGLVVRGRDAQWRPSRIQVGPLDEAVEWMQSRKQTWEARMNRLEDHLHPERRAE
jgi:DNA-binding transcriptional ArsR family regulator